jgi:hypothetical protein
MNNPISHQPSLSDLSNRALSAHEVWVFKKSYLKENFPASHFTVRCLWCMGSFSFHTLSRVDQPHGAG